MDDESLHSLLSRGRLSGAQRDRILERVLDEHATPRRASGRWVVVASVVLPAAAIVALAIGFRGSDTARADSGESSFRPKGNPSGALLEARCPDSPSGQCRSGNRLIFSVEGAKAGGFFAAYAECASRERIWYFPTEDGTYPTVPPSADVFVVDRAARVGEEHGTGSCKIHLFLLDRRDDRALLLAGTASTSATAVIPLTVTP